MMETEAEQTDEMVTKVKTMQLESVALVDKQRQQLISVRSMMDHTHAGVVDWAQTAGLRDARAHELEALNHRLFGLNSELQQNLRSCEAGRKEDEMRLEKLHEKRVEGLKNDEETCKSELADTQRQLQQLQVSHVSLAKALMECEHKLQALQDEHLTLRQAHHTLTDAHVSCDGIVAELRSRLAMSDQSLQVANSDLAGLRQEHLQCLDKAKSDIAHERARNTGLRDELQGSQLQLEHVRQELATLKEAHADLWRDHRALAEVSLHALM